MTLLKPCPGCVAKEKTNPDHDHGVIGLCPDCEQESRISTAADGDAQERAERGRNRCITCHAVTRADGSCVHCNPR